MLTILRLAAALLLAVGLAACSGDEAADTTETETATPSPTATSAGEVDQEVLDAVAQAAQTTADEGTARFEVTVETEGTQAADGQAPVTAEGEEDFENERRQFTFSGPQGELRIIVDGSTAYIEMPATEDEQWAELELDRLSGGDFGFGGPGGLPFQGVNDNVEFLTESATSAQDAGEEDIDGETTTRYELTVDLEAAAGQSDEDTEEGLRRTLEETGVRTLDVTVWVDEEDRIARVRYALDLAQAEIDEEAVDAEPRGRALVTVAYRDYGADLQIDVPSDDQIVEMDEDELNRAFGGQSTGDSGSGSGAGSTSTPTATSSPTSTAEATETETQTEAAESGD